MAADNVNAVTVTAGLNCSALANPPIGATVVSASTGYNNGDLALDQYVAVSATTPTPATALHTALGGTGGFVCVYNPSSTLSVSLYVDTTLIGPLPPGFCVVLPVGAAAIIGGVVDSTAVTVGVSAIKTTANA